MDLSVLSTAVEAATAAAAPMPPTAPLAQSDESQDADTDELVREIAEAIKRDMEHATEAKAPSNPPVPYAHLMVILPPAPTTVPPDDWTNLLGTFPPITIEESIMLAGFVLRPEQMAQIFYEERLAESKTSGRLAPREPTTLLSHDERQHLHALFTGKLLPPHFFRLCKAIFQYVRQHGVDVLAHLPVPIPSLPEADQEWLQSSITNPQKRTYMHYVCACQDALFSGEAVPAEASLQLSGKKRQQIRKAMQDLRAVMSFKKLATSGARSS